MPKTAGSIPADTNTLTFVVVAVDGVFLIHLVAGKGRDWNFPGHDRQTMFIIINGALVLINDP
jgi:hypothetical protein